MRSLTAPWTPDPRFSREVGVHHVVEALVAATAFITFGQNDTEGRGNPFAKVGVESFITDRTPFAIATSVKSRIDLNLDYLQTFLQQLDGRAGIPYFTSGLFCEWTGNGSAPIGLLTGIADYIRLTGNI